MAYQFTFPPTVKEHSLFSTPSPALIVCRFFDDGHSDWCEVISHCSFKRWKEYTKELYKKDLHDPDNHNAVITYLELDILECEVKWALESITTNKASGGDRLPVEYFKS